MKIHDLLTQAARRFPRKIAVVHQDQRATFEELQTFTDALVDYLKALPLQPGDRIGLLFENSIEYIYLFFAIQKAGFVVVPIDTSLKADKIAYILADCDARALFFHAKFRRSLQEILEHSPSLRFLISDSALKTNSGNIQTATLPEILSNSSPNRIAPETSPEFRPVDAPHELTAIFYTSGSTGIPKGVMLSHRNLISNTLSTVEYLKLAENDSVIVILPFYYIYGNSLLLTHIACGGSLVIDNRFMYPEVIMDTMEKEKVTGFSGVPSNFMILLNNTSFPQRRFPDLRYFTQAGGAMAPEVVRRLIDTFPQKETYIMYGQTEAAPRATFCPPERLRDKLGTIGIPVPGVEIKIMNDEGFEVADGEPGEIVIIGPNVMMGYWNQPEEQSQVLRDGRLFSGDLGRKDKDGFIFIIGRKKEIIKVGGNRVSAKEIEERLLENDKISEAAVLGVEDPILGEAIQAALVLKPGQAAEAKEIQKYCREKLAEHKVPKYVQFLKELPKYQSGKVNKLELAKSLKASN